MAVPIFTINLNKKCAECGKANGVAENGLCLGCTTKAIQGKTMRSENGRAVQRRFSELKPPQR